jgi:hypothetical protein
MVIYLVYFSRFGMLYLEKSGKSVQWDLVALPSRYQLLLKVWQPKKKCVKLSSKLKPIRSRTGTDVYDFENIFSEKFSKNIGVFCSDCCYFLQKFDHKIGF